MANEKNGRETLRLGKIGNIAPKNIDFLASAGKSGNKNLNKNEGNKNSDNGNIKGFLNNNSFSNMDLIKQRQGMRTIKNLNFNQNKVLDKKPSPSVSVDEKTSNVVENKPSSAVESSNANTKTNSVFDTHKLLSSFAQKQKEDERIKREEERAKRDAENKKKQEEELRKFNARSRNNAQNREGNSEENNNENNRENRFNNRNSGDKKFGDRKFGDRKFGDKKFGDKKFGENKFNDKKNSENNNDKENPSENINKFNNLQNNINTPETSKTPYKKDSYSKKYSKDFDDDENSNKQVNKKSLQSSSYSKNKNIHTYVLNEDEDDENSFGRKKRKSAKGFYKNKDKNEEVIHQKIIQDIELPEFITVADLAEKMNEKKGDVVKKLITLGMVVTVNQTIDADTAELVVGEFGHNIKKRTTERDIENKLDEEEGSNFVSRAPVVTIMGHVDHGKTSLLDAIRTTNVVEGESGGITQHIGASRVEVGDGKFITFIDTPGHEAFTEMRMRGASITDIVVLVVAADDGVKDQTIEAINHSKAAGVPIILAINKIDKPGADPMRVKQELLQYDIITEDFGGEVMAVEVSAKQKTNLEKLRETILLQAEMMELKAPIDVRPVGAVVEARMDQNKGAIASLLVQRGVLKFGDLVLAGTSYGKIRKMADDKHKVQKEAYPSMAVEVLGLDSVPTAGDQFYVLKEEKEARDIIAYRERKNLENKVAKRSVKSLDSMLKVVGGKSAKLLPVIIKADVNGSIEAIIGTIVKLNTSEVEIDVIHSATGAINETDVNLASVSNALIIGFNVRANSNAVELSKSKDVDIRYYSIIYNIVDDIKNILSGMLDAVKKEEITGHAEIRQVFKVTGSGKVAGCFVLDGEIFRGNKVRLIRDGVVIYSGELKALKRFKDDVKEVKTGYECGMSIDGYDDIKEKDIIEGFKITEEKRSL